MIKLRVSNMSCGHCQLKIKSELEAHKIHVDHIDMTDNSLYLDTTRETLSQVQHVLDDIHYQIDWDYGVIEFDQYIIWDDCLEQDSLFNKFISYLQSIHLQVIGFSDEPLGIKLFCTKEQESNLQKYLIELRKEVK